MKECRFYEKKEDGSVACQACSHFCNIKNGGVGICGIRQNINGKLYLLPYGKAAAVNIDPIEKKPLFHFLPGTYTYSFGTLGCNFRCANCQNFDISQIYGKKGDIGYLKNIDWGVDLEPKDIVSRAKEAGCNSISYTYIEPTIFTEYALDVMKIAHEQGLKNVWVSNGYMSENVVDAIVPFLDAINIDIKSFDNEFYRSNCGAKLQPVLENCRRLARKSVWLEITTLVIPTLSDNSEILGNIAKFVHDDLGSHVPWHVSAFSGIISWKLKHLPSTSLEKLQETYAIGKKAGLEYVYLGNVIEAESENTCCPKCGERVIRRDGFQVSRNDDKGRCPRCAAKIPGVFI
ncbi:MAG: AmmeMemoRadiSam system radical SAM enzyme [Patescibacteria group bacterium]|nr:AmmeMemoRadiSam system radical SAM enzyme [Patescibacteria group bacterium]